MLMTCTVPDMVSQLMDSHMTTDTDSHRTCSKKFFGQFKLSNLFTLATNKGISNAT